MAIGFRAACSDVRGASSTAMTPAWVGSPPPAGDVLVAFVAAIVQTTLTPPDGEGWFSLGSQDAGSSLRMWALWRPALPAGEPGSYNWSVTNATKCWSWVGAYTGVDPETTPGYVAAASSGTALVLPTVAVPDQGWLLSAAAGRHTSTGAATSFTFSDPVPPAAERLDWGSNVAASNDVSGAVYDSNRALAAGSPARTITASQTETLATLMQVTLSAAAGGGGGITGQAGARWGVHI